MVQVDFLMREATDRINNSISMLVRWKVTDHLNAAVMRKLSFGKGSVSQLAKCGEKLLEYIFARREMGLCVMKMQVMKFARKVAGVEFKEKGKGAQYMAVFRFTDSAGLVYCMKTHQSQRPWEEMTLDAKDWIEMVRPMLLGDHWDKKFILNMDHTPVNFSMNGSRTLSECGVETVHVMEMTNDTKRVTVAVTITAAGDQLRPVMVFKGVSGGRIELWEIVTYPDGPKYCLQKKAWMDEEVMLKWVDDVLAPYVLTVPDYIRPILFLDSYRCHMMASVVHKISDLGVEVLHIPGGCTGLCQPVDVRYNKPFKNKVRDCWDDWVDREGFVRTNQVKWPKRINVAGWAVDLQKEMEGVKAIVNAWNKTGYKWFD